IADQIHRLPGIRASIDYGKSTLDLYLKIVDWFSPPIRDFTDLNGKNCEVAARLPCLVSSRCGGGHLLAQRRAEFARPLQAAFWVFARKNRAVRAKSCDDRNAGTHCRRILCEPGRSEDQGVLTARSTPYVCVTVAKYGRPAYGRPTAWFLNYSAATDSYTVVQSWILL